MSGKKKLRCAIFASGKGSNARALIEFENTNEDCAYTIVLIVSSKEGAGVIDVARTFQVPCVVLNSRKIISDNPQRESEEILGILEHYDIEIIALAGYLRKVPEEVVSRFDNMILNVHPSLLPKYGGKGMYGTKVHKSVLENHESIGGVTVHLVNNYYDEGDILSQEKYVISEKDDLFFLEKSSAKAEHYLYPMTLNSYCSRISKTL